ncbi:hypothetical protein [Negadavirga shengliensis]|uniref:Uncharacterized protein n=1 Tax=Negadavirga shengliensis TaxID=1389218 RepID=A0ABV9T8P8_9BACT
MSVVGIRRQLALQAGMTNELFIIQPFTDTYVDPELHEFDVKITEFYAMWLEEKLHRFYTQSATGRYLHLLESHPHIIQYITFIASYLGVSLETLSRIRSKI